MGILLSDNMLRLIPVLERAFADARIPINCPQYRLLIYLSDKNPKILNDVADFFERDKSMMMRHIDQLEACNYITRKINPNDRRRKHLVLTPSGIQALKTAKKVERTIYTRLLKGLTSTEKNIFYDVLLHISTKAPSLESA